MTALPPVSVRIPRRAIANGVSSAGARTLPEETPVALIYDGATVAVMMATPADLKDLAFGFSLTEAIARPDEIRDVDVVPGPLGIELRLWLQARAGEVLARRRRHLAGPTGCGLCGIESLEEAARPLPSVTSDLTVTPEQVLAAMSALARLQVLNRETRAVHAAGYWTPADGMVAVREDVGRHNALDKLAGALAQAGRSAGEGVILLTSRISVELVQKAAMMGAPVLAAVSAPTALALRTAEAAGICVAGIVREDGLEVFTHERRLVATQGAARHAV